MLSDIERQEAADLLWEAEQTLVPCEQLTERYDKIDIVDAYEIQLRNVARKRTAGRLVRGHKVGLSAKAMQQMVGVSEPDYGHLLDNMFFFEADTIPAGRLLQPRVEVEVAFVLNQALEGPGVTVADVLRATDCVLPAIEVVDSRIKDWKIKIQDTVADNASSGAVVLGGNPTALSSAFDIRTIGAVLRVNGEVRETGASGAVLGNPAVAVAWLANKIAAFGVRLEPGNVIMPGSCTRMVPVKPGDVVRADFDTLGHVSIRFE